MTEQKLPKEVMEFIKKYPEQTKEIVDAGITGYQIGDGGCLIFHAMKDGNVVAFGVHEPGYEMAHVTKEQGELYGLKFIQAGAK